MASVVVWTVVALVVAVLVIMVAVMAGRGGGGLRQLGSDLRSGLRREARRDLIADLRSEADDDDAGSSVDEIFAVGRPAEKAYLDPTLPTHRRNRAHPVTPHRRRTERTPSA